MLRRKVWYWSGFSLTGTTLPATQSTVSSQLESRVPKPLPLRLCRTVAPLARTCIAKCRSVIGCDCRGECQPSWHSPLLIRCYPWYRCTARVLRSIQLAPPRFEKPGRQIAGVHGRARPAPHSSQCGILLLNNVLRRKVWRRSGRRLTGATLQPNPIGRGLAASACA